MEIGLKWTCNPMPFQLIVQAPHEQDFWPYPIVNGEKNVLLEEAKPAIFDFRTGADSFLPDMPKLLSKRMNYVLMDIGSTNGTTLNGTRIEVGKPYSLAAHDQIGIGDFVLEFVIVTAHRLKWRMDDPDATVCLQPESTSTETLVEQLQVQYVEMMHLPSKIGKPC